MVCGEVKVGAEAVVVEGKKAAGAAGRKLVLIQTGARITSSSDLSC